MKRIALTLAGVLPLAVDARAQELNAQLDASNQLEVKTAIEQHGEDAKACLRWWREQGATDRGHGTAAGRAWATLPGALGRRGRDGRSRAGARACMRRRSRGAVAGARRGDYSAFEGDRTKGAPMRKLAVLLVALLLVVVPALAFEYTSWSGQLKHDAPKSKCRVVASLDGFPVPQNSGGFVGSLATQGDSFTLTVDGDPLTLPMTAVPKKGGKPSTKYTIEQPTPGQMAQFELSVEAILRRKLGAPELTLTTAGIETSSRGKSRSSHRLKSKFRKVETRIRISFEGNGPLGTYRGTLEVRFKGMRES